MSTITPIAFTGASKFSADLQTILTRTVNIASQPIKLLQNEQTNLVQQKLLATNLNGATASLASALTSLGELGQSRSLVASSSNSAKVSINSTNTSAPATFTISEITSIAHSASATSTGQADAGTSAVSVSGTVRLTFDGVTKDITLGVGENTLSGLRDKINNLGLGLNASILTTGTGATPFYLSLSSATTGSKPITLTDDPNGVATNLIENSDAGANTNFKINGAAVSKNSTTINDVVPGVSFNVSAVTAVAETVTITVGSSRSNLSGKLQTLVSAYNNLLDQTDGQIGASAGLLTGATIVREIKDSLRALGGFEGNGQVKNLAGVGITFGSDGKASFDQTAFNALSDSSVQGVFDFLGSTTTGFGALKSKFAQLSDPVTGLISVELDHYDTENKRITDRIGELTSRVSALQQETSRRLQIYDAILAGLESQANLISSTFTTLTNGIYGTSK